MLSEVDRDWLKKLDSSLWPPDHKNGVVSLEASRDLTNEEYETLTRILDEGNVVVEMICTNMFGGYGIRVYEHESYPGVGLQYLCCVTEDHLPSEHTRFERDLLEEGKGGVLPKPSRYKKLEESGHVAGEGSTRAWNYFSRYTHTDKQREFCKKYKLGAPQPRSHYDY
jgi:hypothetical protein